jgi:hypothetical protein
MEIQTLLEQTNFFFQLYTKNLYILIDFYLVLSRKVCPRSSWPNGLSVKHPYMIHGKCTLFPSHIEFSCIVDIEKYANRTRMSEHPQYFMLESSPFDIEYECARVYLGWVCWKMDPEFRYYNLLVSWHWFGLLTGTEWVMDSCCVRRILTGPLWFDSTVVVLNYYYY